MSEPIIISIVTISYNDLSGLKSTVSIIDKKITNLYIKTEHIIINGRPGDTSDDYIKSIIANRPIETILISEPDKGIYDAMNKGIQKSTGDYIIFINSGDHLVNNYDTSEISILLAQELVKTDSAGIAFGCNYKIFNKIVKIKPRLVNKNFPKMPSLHQGLLYKRSILNKIKFSLQYKICGDFDNFCAILNNYKFNTYNFIIAELVAGGISTNKPILLFNESRKIFKFHFAPNFLKVILYDLRLIKSLLQFQIVYRILYLLNLRTNKN